VREGGEAGEGREGGGRGLALLTSGEGSGPGFGDGSLTAEPKAHAGGGDEQEGGGRGGVEGVGAGGAGGEHISLGDLKNLVTVLRTHRSNARLQVPKKSPTGMKKEP